MAFSEYPDISFYDTLFIVLKFKMAIEQTINEGDAETNIGTSVLCPVA